jgi:hypothetical protein
MAVGVLIAVVMAVTPCSVSGDTYVSEERAASIFRLIVSILRTASVVYWSEFLATDPEVPGSIPGPDFLTSRGSGTGSTQPRDHN